MGDKAAPFLSGNIKLNALARKQHRIFLDEEKIAFGETEINLSHISDLKFGLSLMQFYRFSLGTKYLLSFKSPVSEINLVFRNYLELEKKYFNTLYYQILNAVWDQTADRLFAEKIQQLKSDKGLIVGNCVFQLSGITIYRQNLFSAKEEFIAWEDLIYHKNYNRLSIYSKRNSQIWTNLFYTEIWNVDLLIPILDWLYEQNGLAELNNQ